MKVYTDIEQSKTLSEILPIESADSHYVRRVCDFMGNPIDGKWSDPSSGNPNSARARYIIQNFERYEVIPCWSLTALFAVIPKRFGQDNVLRMDMSNDDFSLWYDEIGYGTNTTYPDITMTEYVDACYDMICNLYKKGFLKDNNKMKPEELQIGDWVYSLIDKEGKTERIPQRVTGIQSDGEYIQTDAMDVWYHIGTFEPIPITGEILENNGFKKDAFTNLSPDYYYGDDECSICINLNSTCDKSKQIWAENKNRKLTVSIEESRRSLKKKPLLLHQLQKVLRICEINKDIKL